MQTEDYTKEELGKAQALDRCIAQINGEEGVESMPALDLETVEWLNQARSLLSQIKQDYEKQLNSIKPDKDKKETTRVMMHEKINRLYGTDTPEIETEKSSLWQRVSRVLDRVVPQQGPQTSPAYRREDEVSALSIHGDEEVEHEFSLVAFLGDERKVIDIPEGESIIGASDEADIKLQDPDHYISGKHAKISRQENELYITDLDSTNGTFLNGEKLKPNVKTKLSSGDKLVFAETPIIVHPKTEE